MKVTFETAAFADSIKQAALVAPTSGSTFDKANGIVLDLDAEVKNGWTVLVRSTNLDVFRMEWLNPESIEGPATRWRLPANLFAKVVSSFPIGTGKQITIEDGRNGLQTYVKITSGRAQAKFNLIDHEYYPQWSIFDPSSLTEALDLGGKLQMVEWAADNGEPPFSGIHFDGERVLATDRYRMAVSPLEIPGLSEPITVPSGVLSQLLKATGEIRLGVEGSQLLVMPDEGVQIRCVIFGNPYPSTKAIREAVYTHSITVKKAPLLEIMQRAQSFGSTDRDSVLRCFIGLEEFAIRMANSEVGVIGDAMEIPGQALHERFEIKFTPKNIIDPLSHSPSEEVVLSYEVGKPDRLVRVDGGNGYYSWGQPRREQRATGG